MKRGIIKKLEVKFYATGQGREPVRLWLKELKKEDKKVIGEDIKTVQFGWPLGMPLVRNLEKGLSDLKGERIARVIFFMASNTMILVHGFIKKSQKTPQLELEIARKRKKQFEI